MGFSIDEEDDAIASHRPNAATGEPENTTGPTAFDNENAGAFEAGSQQANTQGEYTRSSNVDEKEKCKKRKRIAENDNETFRKGMMEVIRSFTESHEKRMSALIEKIGDRDQSDLHGQIYSIIESPIFELYSTEQRIKATMVLCDDVKKMELFIRMNELERLTMMFMIINDKL
ncbi:hypothetical protein P3S67_003155 [Capsicum chacoense]